jgi:iron-sulfur cluster repair protein YtfE (RIC family)
MKRHPALIPLSEDHHQALLLAMLLKKNAPKINKLPTDLLGKMNYAKETYHKELERHFRDEEQFVFPYLNGKDSELDDLISLIIDEHIILKEKILSLKDNPNLADQFDEIGKILDEHVRKEERILFEKAQDILNENELGEIKNKFDKTRP